MTGGSTGPVFLRRVQRFFHIETRGAVHAIPRGVRSSFLPKMPPDKSQERLCCDCAEARALDAWADDHGVQLCFIDPGRPTQNADIERFDDRFRDECLSRHRFTSIGEAHRIIEDWRIDCNTERPQSSLKYRTPEVFAAVRPLYNMHWAQPLELLDGSASAPIADAAG